MLGNWHQVLIFYFRKCLLLLILAVILKVSGGFWTPTVELISRAILDVRVKGELCVRILCIIACDILLHKTARHAQDAPYSQPFLTSFLEELFHPGFQDLLLHQLRNPTRSRHPRSAWSSLLELKLKNGFLNFNHFVSTDTGLNPGPDGRHAALQLSHGQPHWDLLIPIYFGELSAPLNPAHLSDRRASCRERV